MENIKVIVAGGRKFDDYELAKAELNTIIAPGVFKRNVEIVSGRCPVGVHTFTTDDNIKVYGADGLGERYAKEYGFKVVPFPPDKGKGNVRFYLRNKEMAEYGTHCVCFWDGISKGSSMMIDLARKHGLKLVVINYNKR